MTRVCEREMWILDSLTRLVVVLRSWQWSSSLGCYVNGHYTDSKCTSRTYDPLMDFVFVRVWGC
jgi:type IV secretory pathway TrbD component